MKKPIRILLVAGAVFIIMAAGIGLLITNPGVQRAIVIKVLASYRPGTHVELDYIKVGFNRAEVRGLHLLQGNVEMSVERAEFDVAILSYLVSGEVNIRRAEVQGLFLDISRLQQKSGRRALDVRGPPPAPSRPTATEPITRPRSRPRKRPAFEGVYVNTRFAIPIRLGTGIFGGRVLLPDLREMNFDLTIDSLGPGQTGNIIFNGNLTDYSPGAPVTLIDLDGSGTLKQAEPSGLAGVFLEIVFQAHGPSLQEKVILHGKLELKLNEQEESYTVSITRPETSEGQEQGEIVFLAVGYDRVAEELTGRFRVDADDEQMAPFALGRPLPDFLAKGQGEVRYNLKSGVGHADGILKLNADHLERLLPELGPVGAVELRAQVDLRLEQTTVFIDKLSILLGDAAGNSLLRLASRQPFRLDTSESLLELPEVWGDLLDIKIDGLPLAWIEPFLDRPSLDIAGGVMRGGFKVVGSGNALSLESTEPLLLEKVRLAFEEWSSFWEVDVSLEPKLAWSRKNLRLDINRLQISSGGNVLLGGKAALRVAFENGRWLPESAAGQFTAYLGEIQKQPFVADFTGMSWKDYTLQTGFDLNFESGVIGIRTARISLLSGGQPVLISRILQPLDIELENPMRGLENLSGDLLNIELKGLSLDLINQLPFTEKPGLALRAEGLLHGSFILSVDGDYYKLDATRPFMAARLSITRNGKPLVDSIDLTVKPTLLWSEKRLEATLKGLDIKSRGLPLLNGSGRAKVHPGEKQPLAFLRGEFEVDLPGVLSQPLMRRYGNLSSGKLRIKFSFDPEHKRSAILLARFENLNPRNDSGSIPLATLGANIDWKPDGSFTAKLPLDITGTDAVTDVVIALNGKITTESRFVEARISGNDFVLDDLKILARALQAGRAPAAARTSPDAASQQSWPDDISPMLSKSKRLPGGTPTVEPEDRAAWAGFTGHVSIDLKRIHAGGGFSIENLQGKLLVEPDRIVLPQIKADLGESSLLVDGEITFNRNLTLPYQFQARIDLQNFDAGKFLTAANPGRPPAVEGIFNIGGRAWSDGYDLPNLLKRMRGQVQMDSAGGLFRVLEAGGEKAQTGAALAGIAGIFLGDKIGGLNTLNRLTAYLREVPYDEVKIEAVRGQDLNINLTNFTVLGPEIHVSGAGMVQYMDNLPVVDQPLRIDALLAAKGQAAYLLNNLGQLTDRKDAFDFYRGPTFSIRGTPANPDYSELFRLLRSSALGAIGYGGRVDLGGESPEQTGQEQTPVQPAEQPFQDPAQQLIREGLRSIFGR